MLRGVRRTGSVKRIRSIHSAKGDAARDRREWTDAVRHYRRHLLLVPQDAAIWVQFGHCLKEGGLHPEATNAYQAAWELSPEDSDVLLHFGHAIITSGDVEYGKELLRESAMLGNGRASDDLAKLGELKTAEPPKAHREPEPDYLARFTSWAGRLQAIDYSDVKINDDGSLESLSTDPWILFKWREGCCPDTRVALLTIEIKSRADDFQPTAQIFVDTGHGLSESESKRFKFSGGKAHLLVVDPSRIQSLRFDPVQQAGTMAMPEITITPIETPKELDTIVRRHAGKNASNVFRIIDNELHKKLSEIDSKDALISFEFELNYDTWLAMNANPSEADYQTMQSMAGSMAIKPKFSFVMPTYNTPIHLLRECLDAMLAQVYADFEICVADDNSPNREVVEVLEEYAQRDPRVKYVARKWNGHISACSNAALSLATGDFVVLVDHDDLIPDYALFVIAWYINKYPEADVLFSDEDKATITGHRLAPYFKGAFNKYLMYGHNMVSHIGIYRRSLIEKIGGFRLGLEGSQDYDLLLRCLEQSCEERIIHIPHVLYHWRIIPGSTAMSADQKSYAVVAAQNAINGHFERLGLPLRSVDGFAPGCTAVKPSKKFDTSVSIIIPTRDRLELLRPCIDSIFACDHSNAEIIVVDNGSADELTLDYLKEIEKLDNVSVIRDPDDFNFSRINNLAAKQARGEILCFLNNDTEVISRDWLNRARTFLSIDEVGMVGARLLFPDGSLQHFGIVLGMGAHGIAGVPYLGMDANGPGYFGKARLLQEVSAATAACLFMRKRDFDAVGGFEEELKVAYNDIDLCLKIRDQGLKILVDPDISLIHKESHSRGSDKRGARAQRLKREADWMRARWGRVLESDPYYSPNLDLGRVDMFFAPKPRQKWPWELEAKPASGEGTRKATAPS